MARIGLLSLAAATLGLVGSTYGQTVAFNDPATGITFQQKTEDTFTFGMALPDTSSNDFIGRISYQVSLNIGFEQMPRSSRAHMLTRRGRCPRDGLVSP